MLNCFLPSRTKHPHQLINVPRFHNGVPGKRRLDGQPYFAAMCGNDHGRVYPAAALYPDSPAYPAIHDREGWCNRVILTRFIVISDDNPFLRFRKVTPARLWWEPARARSSPTEALAGGLCPEALAGRAHLRGIRGIPG